MDLSREDFLVGNFDLKSLFLLLRERFYSDDFVLWFDTEELSGKYIAFRRMGDVLEPFHTLFEMGMAYVHCPWVLVEDYRRCDFLIASLTYPCSGQIRNRDEWR